MNETKWLTTQEAAKYARIHPKTLTNLARFKKIKHAAAGRKYLFLTEHIDSFLLSNGWTK